MKTRSSAPLRRTDHYRGIGNSWLGAAVALAFAGLPLGVMLWVLPITGIGVA